MVARPLPGLAAEHARLDQWALRANCSVAVARWVDRNDPDEAWIHLTRRQQGAHR